MAVLPAGNLAMIHSKLTSKAQTTIPQAVRTALHLAPGDELVYEIAEGRVTLTKAKPARTRDDPFGTFTEWSTQADAEAYAEL
jgi:antitoxin PrlF